MVQDFSGLDGEPVADGNPTPEERTAILEQLERMLSHQAFKNSKRCTSLLRYLVEQAIDNPTTHIKERTLGMVVFERSASYDTALDPIVRMTSSEIRKRIAQYYHEVNHEAELRIELPAGTYMPQFRFLTVAPPQVAQLEANQEIHFEEVAFSQEKQTAEPSQPKARRLYRILTVAAALLVVGVAVYFVYTWTVPSNVARFWSPLWKADSRVLICLGATDTDSPTRVPTAEIDSASALTSSPSVQIPRQNLPMGDVSALSKIVGALDSRKKGYELRSSKSASLADLRGGPVILIGAFDNDWARRLLPSLRFHFEEDTNTSFIRIRDSFNPARNDWQFDKHQVYKDLKKDYALVSRYTDSSTGTTVLAVAGLRSNGTNAAAEFVSNPTYLNAMGKIDSTCKRNMQIVLQADIIDGVSGPPKVVTVYCW